MAEHDAERADEGGLVEDLEITDASDLDAVKGGAVDAFLDFTDSGPYKDPAPTTTTTPTTPTTTTRK
jgi:hypothetical protein